MNTNTTQRFLLCLILTMSYIASAPAVTDAELEALEQQIQQEEAKEQQRKAALKKQQQEAARREAEKRAEAKRLKEAEQKRLADIDKQRQQEQLLREAEEKKRQQAEATRKQQEQEKRAKYNRLITAAERAKENKDYELAEETYKQALVLYPDDNKALTGINAVQGLIHACDKAVGSWAWFHGGETNIHADGSIDGTWFVFSNTGTWECLDPMKRLVILRWKTSGWIDKLILSEDGAELKGKNQHGDAVSGVKK